MKIYYNDVASRTLAHSDAIKFCEKQAVSFTEANGILLKPNTLLKAVFVEDIKSILEEAKTQGLYGPLIERSRRARIPEELADQMLSKIKDMEEDAMKVVVCSPSANAVVRFNALDQIDACIDAYQRITKEDPSSSNTDIKRLEARDKDIDDVCLQLKQDIQTLRNQLVSEFPDIENAELVEDRDYFPL